MTRRQDSLIVSPPASVAAEDAIAPVQATPEQAKRAGGFDAFVRDQYKGLVRFLTRRTGTVQDAEDLAQESFTRLLRYQESEQAAAGWRPLLYRIAVNASHDHARHNAPYRDGSHLELGANEVADGAPTPEDQTHRAQQRERLRAAILALPPKCRQVWLLRNAHGMSRAQIARHCGISETMVKKHLARALHHIQRQVTVGDGEPL